MQLTKTMKPEAHPVMNRSSVIQITPVSAGGVSVAVLPVQASVGAATRAPVPAGAGGGPSAWAAAALSAVPAPGRA